MRNFNSLSARGILSLSVLAVSAGLLLKSCDYFEKPAADGSLMIHFSGYEALTKAGTSSLPDTSDFLLTVSDGNGKEVYSGTFGNSPEEMFVAPGSYMVSVRSAVFNEPAYSFPLYGDDQCVSVASGERTDVRLVCTMLNSGVSLSFSDEFRRAYPAAALSLSSREGKLSVDYSEKRIAYFVPGTVSLVMDNQGDRRSLFSSRVEPRQVLRVKVTAPAAGSEKGGIHVSVDTSRVWEDVFVDVGDDMAGGKTKDDALDVPSAMAESPAKGVWVYGYITGCFKSTGKTVTEAPFPSATNLAVGPRTSSSDTGSCLSVELKKGQLRDALNLVDNPGLKGRKVFLKGDLVELYYGTAGLKNVSEFAVE